ncbi:hypothetical protein ACFQH8_15895 [Halomicroarcula sp. GCM10025710]
MAQDSAVEQRPLYSRRPSASRITRSSNRLQSSGDHSRVWVSASVEIVTV